MMQPRLSTWELKLHAINIFRWIFPAITIPGPFRTINPLSTGSYNRSCAIGCTNGLTDIFFGVHVLYADYKVAGKTLLNVMKSDYAYDGNAYGGGISYGYQLYLSPHWNIEFTAGIGYVRFEYDKAPFPAGREVAGSYRNDYFGPTKLGISIMYIIK